MKTIIAGSRTITDPKITFETIQNTPFKVSEVVSGCAEGPDKHGELWAKQHDLTPIEKYILQDDKTKLYHFVDEAEQVDDTGYETLYECEEALMAYGRWLVGN